MKKYQTFTFLWLTVIVAIPLLAQAGCANNKPVVEGGQNSSTPAKNNDPCRQGPITRKSAKEHLRTFEVLPKSLNAAQCISTCKQEFTKRKTALKYKFQPLVTLERLEVSNCNIKYSLPGSASEINCDVDYTAAYSPYTCPKISPPQPR
jgi:hypothetical protein